MAEEIINITIDEIVEDVNIVVNETTEDVTITIQEPSKTSDLINDGEDGINPFITAQQVPTVNDATSTLKGILKLTNDLGGTADLPTVPDLVNKVPYTGATADVDLGEKELTTSKLYLYDAAGGPTEKGSLHYADEALHFENSDGETLMYIEPGFMQLHKTGAIQSNFFFSNLTTNRDHYLPDASGTIALTSNITGTNSGVNTGDETNSTIKSKLGAANSTTDGYLTASNWNVFNNKQNSSTRRNSNNSTNSNINYCGISLGTGISDSASVWTIKKLTIATDGSTTITTATNVAWTNRESATYI